MQHLSCAHLGAFRQKSGLRHRNVAQDPKKRSTAEMLWRKVLSEAGPPVSDAQTVTSAMAEAVMAE